MRVKGCEIDSLFYKTLGYKDITECMKGLREELIYKKISDVHTQSKILYIKRKDKFIKDNNINILEFKGEEYQWGDEIYDLIMEIHKYVNENNVYKQEDLLEFIKPNFYIEKKRKEGKPIEFHTPTKLMKSLLDMNVITKTDGKYKWTGSTNYQAITKQILRKYE